MDRQTLLQQKRQRLQELRQRRLNVDDGTLPSAAVTPKELSEGSMVASEVRKSEVSTTKVDAGVQVKKFVEVSRFDKGIQTDKKVVVETPQVVEVAETPELVETPSAPSPEPESTVYIEDMIQVKPVSNTTTGTIPLHSYITTDPVIQVDCYEDLVAIMFEQKVIIFKQQLVAVAVVESVTPIALIRFSSRNKIVGGLKNGKIVAWNLNEDEMLSSPPSFAHKDLHEGPITGLEVIDTLVVSSSYDRINFWSVNFLAYPQQTIHFESELMKPFMIQDFEIVADPKIDDIVICESGLKRLVNDEKRNFVQSTISTRNLKGVIKIGMKDDTSILCGYSQTFDLYVFNMSTQITKITTNYIILGVEDRKGHQFQFSSFGRRLDSTGVVEVWDLSKDISHPIMSINTEVLSVAFAQDFIIVTHSSGVSVYELEVSSEIKYNINDVI